MKNIFCTFCFLLMIIACYGQKLILDKVIAKVGGEQVLLSEVEEQYAYASEKTGQTSSEFKCQILESVIGQKLIIHQAKLDSIIILDEEVQEQLDQRVESVLRQMNGDEVFFEEYYNMSPSQMKDNLRDQQKQQMLAERMQASLMQGITVTPNETVEFFNSIPSDSLPYLNAEVEIGELVFEPTVNDEEKAKARAKAEDLRTQVLAGADFGEIAKKHSQDPGTAAKEGNLGFAKRGSYVGDFEAAAFSLGQNEISEVVETEFGYHIIQMQERRGNNIKLRHILIKPEMTQADLDKAKNEVDSIRTLILDDRLKFERAVALFSSDNSQSKNNSGRLVNPATGNTFFETKDLPTDIYFEIDNLEIGQISEPIEFKSPRGESMYRLIQLQSRTKPHKANLEQDYAKIQTFARENKRQSFFVEWVNEKLTKTFIDVEKNYLVCPNIQNLVEGK